MRSKVFQRVLDNMKKDPWYIKLHRWVVVELHDIKCMGIVKYIKNKFTAAKVISCQLIERIKK
jgi:hypothetical protein